MPPKILDLFCGAGGAGVGYRRAGFDVVGVDIEHQSNYPYHFHKADAIAVLRGEILDLSQFDAIHASPVCHDWSKLSSISGKDGTAILLEQTLDLLRNMSVPWIVENVTGAPLPVQSNLFGQHGVELCGTMFGLKVIRHRLFETSFPVHAPKHGSHEGEFYNPAGHGDPDWRNREKHPHTFGKGYTQRCRDAMGIDWPINRNELAQAIPPAYTEWLGTLMKDEL